MPKTSLHLARLWYNTPRHRNGRSAGVPHVLGQQAQSIKPRLELLCMIYSVFIHLKVIFCLLESSLAPIFESFLTLIPILAQLIILSILLILSKKLVKISENSPVLSELRESKRWFNFVNFVPFVVKKVKNTIAKAIPQQLSFISNQLSIERSHNFVPLCLCNFATLKNKTNPKQTQSKPIFQGSNLILSKKTRIFDKFWYTFLCKTKPNFSKIQIENKGLTTVSKTRCAAL